MKCIKCGGDTKVNDSRPMRYGKWRRRMCLCCNHKFSTIEIELDEYRYLKEKVKNEVVSYKLAKRLEELRK